VYAVNPVTCRPIRSYILSNSDYNPRPTISEAILATLAAPPWFGPVLIGEKHCQESLMSGAIGFNNPTAEALKDAVLIFGPDCPVAAIISFGSGIQNAVRMNDTNQEDVSFSLHQLMMDRERTANEMQRQLANTSIYHRLSIDKPMNEISDTSWSDQDIQIITADTDAYLQEKRYLLDAIVEQLAEKQGSFTLAQISKWNN
jgi:hypothetical protein